MDSLVDHSWLTEFSPYNAQMPRIWMDYCQFLVGQEKITYTRHTFDRALRALPLTQHRRIWPLYIKFIRRHNIPETGEGFWWNLSPKITFVVALVVCLYLSLHRPTSVSAVHEALSRRC